MELIRDLEAEITENIAMQKVSILQGARRVGKTILLEKIFANFTGAKLWLNGEDADIKKVLEYRSVANYKTLLQGAQLLVIDEAHHIDEIGYVTKLMIDSIKPLHIIISGSSAFDLAQQGYPLVGRDFNYKLFPLSQKEFAAKENSLTTKQQLENKLIYGGYPELASITANNKKQQYLKGLITTYLFKDILAFENIKSPDMLIKLLSLLAYQIGQEVSENELSRQLGISKNTVAKYLELLQKVFVIFPLSGYSKNMRKEITNNKKWYFYDVGVRNAIINNFTSILIRQDIGQLWENYIIAERLKKNQYSNNGAKQYFWRTYDQQEIDLLEEQGDNLQAFEMKWKAQKVKPPAAFTKNYEAARFNIIHTDNYLEYIL